MSKTNYIITCIILLFVGVSTAFTWSLQEAFFGPTWLFVFKHIFVVLIVGVPISVITARRVNNRTK